MQRFVVGPQRDHEGVTLVDAWFHSRLKGSHRALGLGEPLGKLDFELCVVVRYMCDSGEGVTGQQAQREPIRVLKNDRVVHRQTKR